MHSFLNALKEGQTLYHPGEYNARRRALITQCEARKDFVGAHVATYGLRPLLADGTPCPNYIERYLDYPAQKQVAALHRSLALAYSVQNGKAMWFAEKATAYDAFLAYDSSQMAVAA